MPRADEPGRSSPAAVSGPKRETVQPDPRKRSFVNPNAFWGLTWGLWGLTSDPPAFTYFVPVPLTKGENGHFTNQGVHVAAARMERCPASRGRGSYRQHTARTPRMARVEDTECWQDGAPGTLTHGWQEHR